MLCEIASTARPPAYVDWCPRQCATFPLIRDLKRITARMAEIDWQRDFFDHRLRHDESLAEKFEYICQNPVRAD